MPTEVEIVKNYFKSKYLHVSTYFIECCLEWVKGEYNIQNNNQLCEEVYKQWLLTDLTQISERSLPQNVSKEKNKTLQGNFAVQIMYIKDISRSALSQLKNIRNMFKLTRSCVEKEENEPQGKRVLYLQVTDGVEYIFAFEYETVQCLNLEMKPGVKIMLSGPLLVKNGEILLKRNNVKVLGGEIEELLICNHPENVLARELKLPENPNPGQIEADNVTIELPRTGNPPNAPNFPPNVPTVNLQNANTRTENIPKNNPNPSTVFQDIPDELLVEFSSNELESEIKEINNLDFDDFIDEEIEEQLNQLNTSDSKKLPIKIPAEPFNYIKQVINNKDQLVGKVVKVKAQLVAVVQKLAFSSSKGWNMKFKITDGTGVIVVDFLSSVLEELFGVSFEQALMLKEKVKNKVGEASEKVKELVSECKNKITLLNCFMGIRVNENSDTATVVWFKPVLPIDLFKMKQRIDIFKNS